MIRNQVSRTVHVHHVFTDRIRSMGSMCGIDGVCLPGGGGGVWALLQSVRILLECIPFVEMLS